MITTSQQPLSKLTSKSPSKPLDSLRRYQIIALITIGAVYLLFLIGASVRASGAGMGCPDWPTCFGQWIPPTHVSQLPANYQEIYIGYESTEFNVVKTWTEYLNRLVGVCIGLLIMLTAFASIPLRNTHKSVFIGSISAFFMVALQGWLGSKVVASNLMPGMITLHMLLALVIAATLIFAYHQSTSSSANDTLNDHQHRIMQRFLIVLGVFIVIQIFMGTQIREMIDFAKNNAIDRSEWVQLLPNFFYVHRSFSAIVLFTHLSFLYWLYRQLGTRHLFFKLQSFILTTIILTILFGAILNHAGFPAFVQPLHLLLATICFGLQFFMILQYLRIHHIRIHHNGFITQELIR